MCRVCLTSKPIPVGPLGQDTPGAVPAAPAEPRRSRGIPGVPPVPLSDRRLAPRPRPEALPLCRGLGRARPGSPGPSLPPAALPGPRPPSLPPLPAAAAAGPRRRNPARGMPGDVVRPAGHAPRGGAGTGAFGAGGLWSEPLGSRDNRGLGAGDGGVLGEIGGRL